MGFGNYSFIDGQYSISLGIDHDIRGDYSIMMGYLGNMGTLADYSVGIGDRVNVAENDAVGIGRSVDVDNQFAIAIGSTTVAQNDGAIVIGYQASSTDPGAIDPTNNIAIGNAANVQGTNAIAIGNAATAVNDNTMVLGGSTNPLSVGIGTDAPNTNASLDLTSASKGLHLNRMTTAERTAFGTSLAATDEGMVVYDTETDSAYYWTGSNWSSMMDTDTQDLSLSSNTLSLTDGGSVDLSPYLDNTDAQAISVSSDILSITGDAGTVDLSGYLDNTDAQEISLATNTLSITGSAATVDLSGYLDNTDAQNLALAGTTLNISGGTGVDLAVLQDGTGTDSQNLSLSGTTLNITGGTGVDLASLADGTGTDDQNLTSATLSGNTLTVAIEGGTSVNVDLSPILATLEAENSAQQVQIDDLLTRMADVEACACGGTLTVGGGAPASRNSAALYQNIPNPFNETSLIRYYLPLDVNTANIVFSDTSGKIMSNVTLRERGEQEMSVNKQGMQAGMYYYSLYIDGRLFDTKKMIIE